MINKIIDKIKDKKILILGFGREGKTTYSFIRKYLKDQKLTILDENKVDYELDDNTELVIKKIDHDTLYCYDLIFKSPGISLNDIDTITGDVEKSVAVDASIILAAKENEVDRMEWFQNKTCKWSSRMCIV